MSFLNLGTVYGTLLNFRAEHDAMAAHMNEAPYKAPPRAPVLYIKPANTWSAEGAPITVPARVPQVEIGATVGMVMKDANEVAGYVLMNDLSIPHESLFRPPVKYKCLDGFLGVGAEILPAAPDVDPGQFKVEVRVNGELVQAIDFSHLVRSAPQLLADVSEFMSFAPGDVLMLGCDTVPGAGRPRAAAGDIIRISAQGLGQLINTLVAEEAA